MNVAIIDYGSGNLRSAAKAFERVSKEKGIQARITVTAEAEEIVLAERIVLPGVGAFADCLAGLDSLPGMRDALYEVVIEAGRPFLGICVGMHLMAKTSHENGTHQGLGWLTGEVVALPKAAVKVPHMGWNVVHVPKDSKHPILSKFPKEAHAYFVHSYFFSCKNADDVLATVD